MDNEVRYNPNPPKTIEVANINTDYTSGGWVGGVDDTNGYVIVSDTTSHGLTGSGTGGGIGGVIGDFTPVFWVSNGRTDSALIDLANRIPGSPSNFTDINTVLGWINTSSYSLVNYGVVGDNSLTFILAGGGYGGSGYTGNENWGGTPGYRPAIYPGEVIFPDHSIQDSTNNINDLILPTIGVYFNSINYYGIDVSSQLQDLIGNVKRLTFTQGSNVAIFQTSANSFAINSFGTNALDYFNDGGAQQECTLIQAATGNFVYGQLITVTIT